MDWMVMKKRSRIMRTTATYGILMIALFMDNLSHLLDDKIIPYCK